MAENPASPVVSLQILAAQADDLSRELDLLRSECVHESTAEDIFDVVQELRLLCTESRNLQQAVATNQQKYTRAFDEDLAEIHGHLGGIFDDITDCCRSMHKADGPGTTAVGWLHKKRYVKKLQKHLEANKRTLMVMRTVLHHGREYGTHSSSRRLAESSPHTLQEDRAILESILANSTTSDGSKTPMHPPTNSADPSPGPKFDPGAHGRNLSSATGVDAPLYDDVLPASGGDHPTRRQDALARRFSRRGMRLAVHNSILDMNAHERPLSLQKRWIQHHRTSRSLDHAAAETLSIGQLSKISEVNSSSGSNEAAAPSRAERL